MNIERKLIELMAFIRKTTVWPMWPWPLTLTSDIFKTCNLGYNSSTTMNSCWYIGSIMLKKALRALKFCWEWHYRCELHYTTWTMLKGCQIVMKKNVVKLLVIVFDVPHWGVRNRPCPNTLHKLNFSMNEFYEVWTSLHIF